MIWHVGSQITTTTGQILGLLKGEAISTHQHLKMTVIPEAHHHANAGQVVANPLPHADAVSPLVALWRILEIVVKTVESADEGVVATGLCIRQLAIAEIDAAVVTNTNESPLTRRRAVAPFPDATAEFEISQRNSDFASGTVHMPLVHRTGHIGEGGTVLKGIQFSIPTLKQPEAHLARVEIKGVHLVIRDVVERFAIPTGGVFQPRVRSQRGWRRCRSNRNQPTRHNEGRQKERPAFPLQTFEPRAWTPGSTAGGSSRPPCHAARRSCF